MYGAYFIQLKRTANLANWRFGPEDYEEHLLQLTRSRRCLMWCCVENACLSYYFGLPNKFFQALAIGIPVIAMRGTWLACIVERHGLGAIFEEGGLGAIIAAVNGPEFETWCSNIAPFRERIRDGRIKI